MKDILKAWQCCTSMISELQTGDYGSAAHTAVRCSFYWASWTSKKYQLLRSMETKTPGYTLKLDDREAFQLLKPTQKGINEDGWVGCTYEKRCQFNNCKNMQGVDHLTWLILQQWSMYSSRLSLLKGSGSNWWPVISTHSFPHCLVHLQQLPSVTALVSLSFSGTSSPLSGLINKAFMSMGSACCISPVVVEELCSSGCRSWGSTATKYSISLSSEFCVYGHNVESGFELQESQEDSRLWTTKLCSEADGVDGELAPLVSSTPESSDSNLHNLGSSGSEKTVEMKSEQDSGWSSVEFSSRWRLIWEALVDSCSQHDFRERVVASSTRCFWWKLFKSFIFVRTTSLSSTGCVLPLPIEKIKKYRLFRSSNLIRTQDTHITRPLTPESLLMCLWKKHK